MNLLYLIFGIDATIHLQASFSIYSFLTQAGNIKSVNIITDHEEFYHHLGSHVKIIKLTEAELEEWKGKYGFIWRIKIKALERICGLCPNEPILYLDTDTFLYGELGPADSILAGGQALMHENEGILSRKKNKTQKLMWQQIADRSFGDLRMQPSDCMWNSGVVGIPNTQGGGDCRLALTICDEMCDQGVQNRFVEQYALSLALSKCYGILEVKDRIAHYWSNKELWNRQINYLFIRAFMEQWSYEKIISEVARLDTGRLPVFRIKNTNERLKEIVDMAFPVKEVEYLSKK